jgi:hypothetical protein
MQTLANSTEESTYIIKLEFKDEEGGATSPATMVWSLRDENGNIVNNRESTAISDPSSIEYIVLGTDDLSLSGKGAGKRYIVCEGTYDSPTHGSGIPLNDSAQFGIENLIGV